MRKDLERYRYINSIEYRMCVYTDFDYTILKEVGSKKPKSKHTTGTINNIIIMADTETSKKNPSKEGAHNANHVVAWTITLHAERHTIATLYGTRPSEIIECMTRIHDSMQGDETLFFIHNLGYDWQFLRLFCFREWGTPEKQLNTKPHYPIRIEFENGIIFRDSLILAQRTLEKWAKELCVTHQKAVGKWDYDKIRNQGGKFTADELEYIEYDTLAGVECLQVMCDKLDVYIFDLPYTATGIVRRECIKIGKKHGAKRVFNSIVPPFEVQQILEKVFHGGYTHANRSIIGYILHDRECNDFVSSYLYVMLAFKFPMEKFGEVPIDNIDHILDTAEDHAYLIKLCMANVKLKRNVPMPVLQFSKTLERYGVVMDNGRILTADYIEIYVTEIDLKLIVKQYSFDYKIDICYTAIKDYLPRWFTDFIYDKFKTKCALKHDPDHAKYSLAKGAANSCYGMTVQRPVDDDIDELYSYDEMVKEGKSFVIDQIKDREELEKRYQQKYVDNKNKILPYQWGCWVTAYAMENLFKLGEMYEEWDYSDTDSVYGLNPDYDLIRKFNEECTAKLKANGYDPVNVNGELFYLGTAEHVPLKDDYSEFTTQGAKRYCGRCKEDNALHITVAGVPKTGYQELDDDIKNFRKGKIFHGTVTGKLQHQYIYEPEIYIDENGNETGDSIDLTPSDYTLDNTELMDLDGVDTEEWSYQIYED